MDGFDESKKKKFGRARPYGKDVFRGGRGPTLELTLGLALGCSYPNSLGRREALGKASNRPSNRHIKQSC